MKSHVFAEASSQTIRIQGRIHPDPKLACLMKCSVLCCKIQDPWPDPNPDPAGSREADLGNIVYCGMKSKSQGRIHPDPKLVCFMKCSVLSKNSFILFPIPWCVQIVSGTFSGQDLDTRSASPLGRNRTCLFMFARFADGSDLDTSSLSVSGRGLTELLFGHRPQTA